MKKLLFLAAIVFLFGCKSKIEIVDPIEITPTESAIDLQQIKRLSLQLVSIVIDDQMFHAEESVVLLNVDVEQHSYSGNSGCNSFFGSVDIPTENKIYFNVGGMTEMMCAEDIMEWEDRFLNALMETEFTVSEHKDRIIFSNEQSTKVLNFTKTEN